MFQSQPDSWEVLTVNGQRVPDNVELPDTWRAMEAVYEKGMARAIGLSNFTLEQIQEIYQHAKVKPHNLQVYRLSQLTHRLSRHISDRGSPLFPPTRTAHDVHIA